MEIDVDTRAAWLAWRREGIGGSDIAAVCGASPYASPLSVYLRKIGELPDDAEMSRAMLIGKRMETPLADWFSEDAPGLYVVGAQTWCVHPELTWARCTVDGFVAEHPHEDADRLGVFESKTAGMLADYDPLPEAVALQVQWQMFVTDLPRAWVYVHGGGFHGQDAWVIPVARDEERIAELAREGARFWRSVEDREPPEPSGYWPADAADLAAAYPEPEPLTSVELGDAGAHLVEECRANKAAAKVATERAETAANALKALLGDTEAGLVDGFPAVTWKARSQTTLDSTRLRAEEPELAERYSRTTTSRTFLVK